MVFTALHTLPSLPQLWLLKMMYQWLSRFPVKLLPRRMLVMIRVAVKSVILILSVIVTQVLVNGNLANKLYCVSNSILWILSLTTLYSYCYRLCLDTLYHTSNFTTGFSAFCYYEYVLDINKLSLILMNVLWQINFKVGCEFASTDLFVNTVKHLVNDHSWSG